ncbi:DUF4336 domain-containing protein [Nostoc sp. LEGE 06077]|uniref:DUF4336 domain-containing protein n=1 Tax=Nostoc sp. LEGE 06077 TaxID=915325 RepID=UPI0018828AB1|nr:DUF4336 domain-containing protein [Nostoc sp. LEGE 06077]MBE9206021.1 DUF4336 domain-containing protein [Nostoc sp. LEGE 06077]
MHSSNNPKDWSWPFWPVVPLYPYSRRRTRCQEIVKDTIWTFEQFHGILYTIVPMRMTVIKLTGGGLLVYAPVAPTKECVRMVKELVAKHGAVKYIILPTSSGLEHKVFVGPFARCFPQAQVFVAPHQWSFPFNLPLSWLGFPQNRTQELPEDASLAPFADDFEYEVLDINLGRGSFVEVAFLHKRSHTLLLTDTIISVAENPPAIFQLDPYPLLFHARENALQPIEDNPVNRRQGWQRISLFAVYFRPSALEVTALGESFRDAVQAPDHSRKAYFGLYPFRWQANWQQSFHALSANGRPFVAPILQTLILPQAPQQVIDWANKVATWDFYQIISCHFDAPIATSPRQFRQAFSFLEKQPSVSRESQPLSEEDCKFIKELEANLLKQGIATPPKEKV